MRFSLQAGLGHFAASHCGRQIPSDLGLTQSDFAVEDELELALLAMQEIFYRKFFAVCRSKVIMSPIGRR